MESYIPPTAKHLSNAWLESGCSTESSPSAEAAGSGDGQREEYREEESWFVVTKWVGDLGYWLSSWTGIHIRL